MEAKRQRRKTCYCGASLLDDGTCRYKCAPEANPRYLREQRAKARAVDKQANMRGASLTDEERKKASDAVAKMDPVYSKQRGILFGAALKSHKAGARR
jgi:hypothetical protein